MTTNGGKYRFNLNLYADGKVCLSLLGTWSGPGWVSGKSTLLQVCAPLLSLGICAHTLQVLISIQSMIPCEEPYLNEPGWANDGGTPQSRQCEWLNSMISTIPDFLLDSFNVWRMVVKTAMLGNLKNPLATSSVRTTASNPKQLDKWLILDDSKATIGDSFSTRQDSSGSSNGFKKDVEEMQQLLRQMQDDTFKVDK
ncbi:hypothetical protein BDR07DRAFT_1463987 [Suillus spraguei]|nr:hypothetical protein BDR07DRAFT_1463987 [Suillus spraguei]